MFGTPQYTQNSFNVFFPRQKTIRHKSGVFETILKDKYSPPLVLPTPDDTQPQAPRIIFSSKSGYSQIIITQISIALNVEYSPDYQIDISKGQKYLTERIPILFKLINKLNTVTNYCGFTTTVKFEKNNSDDKEIVIHIADMFLRNIDEANLYDIEFKTTNLIENRFYSNITISNYRTWQVDAIPQSDTRMSNDDAVERGVQITGDYNDRYAYNQNKTYRSGREVVKPIIENGLSQVAEVIKKIQGEQ